MQTKLRYLTLAIATLLPLGCGGENHGEVVQSSKQRITSPSVSAANQAELSHGNTAFAADLYQQLRSQPGNLFYSPYSISLALAMTYGGARGNTEAEMAKVMHYALPQSDLHPAFDALDLALASRGAGAAGKDGGKFRLNIANSTWGQKGYSFLPDYLDLLALDYGAGMRLLDFMAAPEPSRLIINDWVEQKTESRIKNLIPQGIIDPSTRLVLTNAVYFNAAWREKFEATATHDDQFTKLDGSQLAVRMMVKTDDDFRYAKAEGCEAVEIPYDGEELSMVVMRPQADLDTFEKSLTGASLEKILASLGGATVELSIPKFKVEGEFRLAQTLGAMGMKDAVTAGIADFSGMDGSRLLYIGEVIHKSFIEIDEAGTEAAAATAVIMRAGAAPGPDHELHVVKLDKPFLFVIRDIKSGAILFLGRVANPAA
jgi:serpin B